jgi:tetratricopeptide (TPR) repeat protein
MSYKSLTNKYLTNTKEESMNLEDKIRQDEDLQDNLLETIIHAHTEKHLRHKIQEQINSGNKRKLEPMIYVSIAASILLIIVISFFFTKQKNIQKEELEYYAYYPGHSKSRGIQETKRLKAFAYYETENYPKAFEEFKKQTPTPQINLYLGICLLHQKDKDKIKLSISYFEKVIHSNTNLDETAEWFLALAYILTDNKAKAKPILDKICNDKLHYNHLKAIELMKKIF